MSLPAKHLQISALVLALSGGVAAQILVAGQSSQNVGVFDRMGNLQSLEPLGFACADIAVDAFGDVFVCSNGGEVRRYDSNFSLITSWSRGTTTYGIAIRPSNGNVFICGSGSASVREYTTSGVFVQDWSPGGGNIRDIAFDASDNMWVTSFSCNCVQVLTPGGVSLSAIFPAGMAAPFGLASGPGGAIWANNQNDHRVIQMDGATRTFVSSFLPSGFSGQYRNMGIDDLGQVYVGQHSTGQVDVYDSAGVFQFSFSTPGLTGIHSVHYSGLLGGPPPPGCTLALTSTPPVVGEGLFEVAATSASSPSVDVTYSYSTDAGATWLPATPGPTSSNPQLAVPTMTPTAFGWDSVADGVATVALVTGVLLRAEVDDSIATATCDTLPFDVDNSPLCGGICGDCDTNGLGPDILDALQAAQIAAGLIQPTPQQAFCCDINSSMTVEVLDALGIAQEAAGLAPGLVCF